MSFHNTKSKVIDWIKFDSTLEANYYEYLKVQKQKKIVKSFTLQPIFTLFKSSKELGLRAMTYVADFLIEYPDGRTEVIDTKWMATEASKLKRKLYIFIYKNDPPLKWICKYAGEWVDYFENNKRRNASKKEKLLSK